MLLVDDYGDVREMYAEYLALAGFEVEEARTGLEALQKAIELTPDLILMDLRLPGMDGWEATRRIKQDDRTRRIPVIALTAQPAEEAARGAREAGCDGFIPKPWLPQDLADEVRRWLPLQMESMTKASRTKKSR